MLMGSERKVRAPTATIKAGRVVGGSLKTSSLAVLQRREDKD